MKRNLKPKKKTRSFFGSIFLMLMKSLLVLQIKEQGEFPFR
nr:MAG TPA: hypothetical protein [Caudoviricetes sp.]